MTSVFSPTVFAKEDNDVAVTEESVQSTEGLVQSEEGQEVPEKEEAPQEVKQKGEKKELSEISQTEDIQTKENELVVNFQLKGATYFDGTPWSGTPQKMVEYKEVEVPYNGWQLMQLTVEIPYQDGLEVTSIQPSVESLYPEYSKVEKDDKNSKWIYKFYFYKNGTYDFTIDYTLNGEQKAVTRSHSVEGLVSIKDAAMRRHLINEYGDLSGISWNSGQYVTEDILGTPLYDPWGNLSFDFGKDGDNGSTAQYTTSLDGLQYLKNIHGMYLFDCRKLAPGETIEPITKTVYPNMELFRLTEITESSNNMPEGSYTPEMIADAIGNMPNLHELSISGTGFVDLPVIGELNGELGYLEADKNKIKSIEGIEKHPKLYSISLGINEIESIQPFEQADLSNVTFMDLGGNHIFDLRPLHTALNKEIVGGKRFGAFRQTITYDKTVIASLQNDNYEMELPMPIDIDGALTDTDKVVAALADGTVKEYSTTKRDGKTYISIPKEDVDNTKENPFEGQNFKFDFNNKNGNDTRTKAGFSGTVTFKASPFAEQYHVVYDFKSGTRGKGLPKEVTDLLPVDPGKYDEGATITAIGPDETTVKVTDGVWTFKGYDADSKVANAENADKNRNIKFTGTWEFNPNASDINHVPTITADDKTLTVGDKFDPLEGVTAEDKEDGNLTSEVKVLNSTVDTEKAGVYEVTYKVTDSKGASSTKTIQVTVKEKEVTDPDDGQKPDDGGNPGEGDGNKDNGGNQGKSDTPKTGAKTPASDIPKTGDTANLAVWFFGVFVSGTMILTFVFGAKKRRRKNKTNFF